MNNEFIEEMENILKQVNSQTDIYFMKLVGEFVNIYDKISYMYATQSKRLQETNNAVQDILHKLEDSTLTNEQLQNLAIKLRDLRIVRRHTNREFALECTFSDIKKDILFNKELREQTMSMLKDTLDKQSLEWNNRVISNEEFDNLLGNEPNEEETQVSIDLNEMNLNEKDKLCIDLYNKGLKQKEIAEELGVSQGAISIRIKKLKERGGYYNDRTKRNDRTAKAKI